MLHKETDVLIVGAGLAGLEAAWAANAAGARTLVLSKGPCASGAVLGFNAPVGPGDSLALFCQDTFRGGWELGDPALIRRLAEGAVETVFQMEGMGQRFDREETGYRLLQPLGCSVPRLVHSGNQTGRISMALLRGALEAAQVPFLENCMALRLLKKEGRVQGALALALDTMEPLLISCKAVALCTGGAHVMGQSTYPLSQTADGLHLAWEAGTALTDLEFIQFEPCRAVWPRPLGISTTLLSRGGTLKNRLGERFVLREYESEGAAPKDQLARLIALELAAGRGGEHGGVYLDLTGLPETEIKERHSLYYRRFLDAGIDLTRQIVEVGPAAHSMMGGVKIDENACASVAGLYAAGEVTGGLHGANRLGGNAGAETYVFGRIAGRSAALFAKPLPLPAWQDTDFSADFPAGKGWDTQYFEGLKGRIRQTLAQAAGPVRTEETLAEGVRLLQCLESQALENALHWSAQKAKLEALHLARTGLLICRAALARRESRGVHYRQDYPARDDAHFKKSLIQQKENTEKGSDKH